MFLVYLEKVTYLMDVSDLLLAVVETVSIIIVNEKEDFTQDHHHWLAHTALTKIEVNREDAVYH